MGNTGDELVKVQIPERLRHCEVDIVQIQRSQNASLGNWVKRLRLTGPEPDLKMNHLATPLIGVNCLSLPLLREGILTLEFSSTFIEVSTYSKTLF